MICSCFEAASSTLLHATLGTEKGGLSLPEPIADPETGHLQPQSDDRAQRLSSTSVVLPWLGEMPHVMPSHLVQDQLPIHRRWGAEAGVRIFVRSFERTLALNSFRSSWMESRLAKSSLEK
ncbi:hypothetical protein PRZ48_010551 [Zasmidium cellare]|uniref:Uncharacterized protein n=1 Tax=Zasmidium cellare TaxID=395010 RepID=A0ABR0E8Z9_ZASCE|nr:hypothetical protein PRZ48_010551 [Zasmidium cellare]